MLCEPILEVISIAPHYPKIRKRIAPSNEELDRYVQVLRYMANVVDPEGVAVEVPRAKDDEVILPALVFSRADWLVTSDVAPLALADRCPIVTPAIFAARYLS